MKTFKVGDVVSLSGEIWKVVDVDEFGVKIERMIKNTIWVSFLNEGLHKVVVEENYNET